MRFAEDCDNVRFGFLAISSLISTVCETAVRAEEKLRTTRNRRSERLHPLWRNMQSCSNIEHSDGRSGASFDQQTGNEKLSKSRLESSFLPKSLSVTSCMHGQETRGNSSSCNAGYSRSIRMTSEKAKRLLRFPGIETPDSLWAVKCASVPFCARWQNLSRDKRTKIDGWMKINCKDVFQ